MSKFFKNVPIPRHQRNAFDLSHTFTFSAKMGDMIPIYWDDVVPGDTFKVSSEALVRFAPLLAPVMTRINVRTHYFFVPYRLLWHEEAANGGWEDFITNDPEQNYTTLTWPYVTMSNANKLKFGDTTLSAYLGLPDISGGSPTQDIDVSCLPFFAYHLIWDDYYRDENLATAKTMRTSTGAGVITLSGGDRNSEIAHICMTSLDRVCWEKDYFTSALPYAYKGLTTDVELDMDIYIQASAEFRKTTGGTAPEVGDAKFAGSDKTLQDASGNDLSTELTTTASQGFQYATLELLEFRRSEALGRLYEAMNRGGHRYVEHLLGVYGVVSDDARLAVPEYLGGGIQPVQISEVLSTAETLVPSSDALSTPPGTMAGHGISMGRSNTFTKTFKEHGIVMGIMSVLPRTAYYGGIEKFWRKDTWTDFFMPQLQGIGDQQIDKSEVSYNITGTDKDDAFGYSERWAEYKFKNSRIAGDFISTFNYWHLCRLMGLTGATLNEAFVTASTANFDRIFADDTAATDKLYVNVYNNVLALRPMVKNDYPRH